MNKHIATAITGATILASIAFVGTGCATIENPMTVPQGPRDSEIYEAGKQKTERKDEKKFTVDVYVDCEAVDLQRVSISDGKEKAHLVSTIDGYLRSKLQKFPFFKVTTADGVAARVRARRMANAIEAGDEPEIAPREEAQYVILAKIDSVMSHGDGGVANSSTVAGAGMGVGGIGSMAGAVHDDGRVSATGMGTGTTLLAAGGAVAGLGNGLEPNVVDISMTFEFFDNVHEETITSENVVRKESGSSKDNTPALVLSAARKCVDEFVSILSRDYLQEARVLETRGDGKYAWISIGQKDGVAPGTKVMFYEFADLDDVMDSWVKTPRPVAYGSVVGIPDAKTCWARVEQSDAVHVKKFHFVKVIAVPKGGSSFLERVGR